jgi:hypothetical protein
VENGHPVEDYFRSPLEIISPIPLWLERRYRAARRMNHANRSRRDAVPGFADESETRPYWDPQIPPLIHPRLSQGECAGPWKRHFFPGGSLDRKIWRFAKSAKV